MPEDPAPTCPPRRDHLGVKTCQVPVVVPPRAMAPEQVWVRGWAGVQGGGALISGYLRNKIVSYYKSISKHK